jgi:energy-coupling factor transport system ATP-binding protein
MTARIEGVALAARDATFAYEKDPVLEHISMDIVAGEFVALVGHTGSGKSTLLRLLAGLEAPTSGDVRIAGVSTARARDRRRLFGRVGYAMQRPERQLFCDTVREDVAYGPSNLGLDAAAAARRADGALAELGIEALADRSPFALSGGQQRLCALAGILAMEPGVVLFDEPLAGLDPAGRDLVRDAIVRVNAQGATVVMVTHDMNDAATLARRVCVLDHGRLVADGAPDEVFSDEKRLHDLGLGLPDALSYARELEKRCGVDLGSPLDAGSLADAVAAALARKGAR